MTEGQADSIPIPIKDLIQIFHRILIQHNEVILGYLYGSYVDGGWRPTSDIDVGIVVNPSVLMDHWFSIKLKHELEDALNQQFVIDLRILNDRSPKFQYNVIFNHPRVIVREEQFRVDYECRVLMTWYDLQPTYEKFYSERNEVLNQL